MYQGWAAAAGTRWSFTAKFVECWKFESGNYRSINDKLFPAFPQMGLNKGWYTDDIHFEGGGGGGGGVMQKLDVIRHHGWMGGVLGSVLDVQSLFFSY